MLNLEAIINDAYEAEEKKNDPWRDSPYKNFRKLSIDGRGKIGELIISRAITEACNESIVINEDVSDVNKKGDDIHYDIKVNNILIEIKTAYRGNSSISWQHENLYKTGVDMAIFLDFDYNGIYLSVIPETLLPLGKDSEIFGRKHGTLRQHKDDGYKLDFSPTTLKNLHAHGYSYYFDIDNATLENIGKYIVERILNYVDSISKS